MTQRSGRCNVYEVKKQDCNSETDQVWIAHDRGSESIVKQVNGFDSDAETELPQSGSAVNNWSRSVQHCGRTRKRQYNITSGYQRQTRLHVRPGSVAIFHPNRSSAVFAQQEYETGWMRIDDDSYGIPVPPTFEI